MLAVLPAALLTAAVSPGRAPLVADRTASTDTLPATADTHRADTSLGPAVPVDLATAQLSGDPWTLYGSRLALRGSVFRGVVTVPTTGGSEQVLKFTVQAVDIADLDMTAKQSSTVWHVQADRGVTSTITGGAVTLYLEKLSGTLTGLGGGLLPADRRVTLTPDSLPPWLYDRVAEAPVSSPRTLTFSDVTLSQVGELGGELTVPGLHLFNTST